MKAFGLPSRSPFWSLALLGVFVLVFAMIFLWIIATHDVDTPPADPAAPAARAPLP